MSSSDWKQLISAYYDGALSDNEKLKVEELLAKQPEYRSYLQELKKLSSSLGTVPNESLSRDAELKILSNIKKERPMNTSSFKVTTTVLATLVICVLVFHNYSQRGIQGRLKSANDNIGDQFSPGNVPTRALQAKTRDASNYMATAKSSTQYQPYYMKSVTEGSAIQLAASPQVIMASGVSRQSAGMAYQDSTIYPYQPYYRQEEYQQYYQQAPSDTAEYNKIEDNKFLAVTDNPLSTFSIDVDTASYSNVRRFLTSNQLPPKDAVRIEEMINYFRYDYPQPKDGEAFSVTTDIATCPWNSNHQLFRIGLKGKTPDTSKLAPSNLVFLIDTSGSMQPTDRLPLIKEGFKMMVRQLRPEDKVAIVVYAGNAGKLLESTSGAEKDKIINAIDSLGSGGSTAGGAGIQLAYQLAKESFIKDGNNRVILATDGDFNVGVSSTSELTRMIEDRRKDGIFLTVLGVGNDNLKDGRMESLADKGNGNYYYLDSMKEAKKVMVDELGSTIFAIAKDVKIQIEFNPGMVKAYRLVGYENRMLAKEDFNDDKKDAGEIGAGHTVTALYEIVPASANESFGNVDNLKYQKVQAVTANEMMTVKLRYKEPTSDTSQLITKTISPSEVKAEPTGDFAWASSVAEFGMLLRNSEHKGSSSYEHVIKTAKANIGDDKFGLRQEFVTLAENASNIAPTQNGQINFK